MAGLEYGAGVMPADARRRHKRLQIMEQFGKYQLRRRIGAGGMAEVFLARTAVAHGLAKDLVIKKIHSAHARSPHFVSMFVDEAKIALGLNHPNIVQVFDFGQVSDTFFLAMEYIAGIDLLGVLQEILKQKRRIPMNLCAYIVQEMAKGLDYAHRKTDEFGDPLNIVHRDISPQNALVSWDGAVKIVDFGIARARGIQDEEGVIKGKYSYMAPEQARGQLVDRRADVYSAGVVLFELVCARPLFPGRGKKVLARVRAGEFPKPTSVDPNIPESLERIMLSALATDPDERFQTARELQLALTKFQFEQAQSASDIVDSETVAAFLAEAIPKERRPQHQKKQSPPVPPMPAVPSPRLEPADSAPAVVAVPPEEQDDLDDLEPPMIDDEPLAERFDTVDLPREPEKPIEVRTRKHVVVLEGYVRGFAALEQQVGRMRAQKTIAQFLDVARSIAFKHDSYVHRAEDSSITVLVGLPMAREDDASRTISLGLALIDALDGIGHDVGPDLRLSVGVQRGNAVVVSSNSRAGKAELAASERSMARHLSKQAPGGEILVGSQVYRVAKNDWYFESMTIARLTDEQEADSDAPPATVYRLRGPKERAARLRERLTATTEVIGRDLEMKALRDAYRDVINTKKVRQILLFGEAGVGKRTIVNAFLASIPKGEAVVMRAATQVASAYTPYSMLADLARDMLGLAEGADPREVKRRIQLMLPLLYPNEADSREARAATAAVSMLLGSRSETPEFDAEELRDRIVQIVLRIQKLMQPTKPIIVVGEDLHWADDESLELFRHILELPRQRATLGIVTSRSDERVSRIARELSADVMHVGELDPEVAAKLITRRFAQDTEPTDAPAVNELAEQIIARTGGNPFFIHEVLDSLIDRGIITVQAWSNATEVGAATTPEKPGLLRWESRGAPIQVPTSIESLLATRIDRLPLSQKQALIHAAVFGRMCTTETVGQLLERAVRDDLQALTTRGLLQSGSEDHYAFRNDMTMSVAYGLLPAEDRSRLHRLAASIVQEHALYGDAQGDAVVARHHELAGDRELAADRYLAAASHAIDVGANGDALRLLERVLKLSADDDHERMFTVQSKRERILGHQGQSAERGEAIAALHRAAEGLGQPGRRAQAYLCEAKFHLDSYQTQEAERATGPALQHAIEAGDQLAQANALRLKATVARIKGDIEDTLALCKQALALCDDSREGMTARALIINTRGGSLWTMGRLEESIESFAETLVIYRMLELSRNEANALNNMGIVFSAMGEYEEALAHYKSALEIHGRLGDRGGVASKLSNIGQAYIDLGDPDRAERYLRKALRLAEQVDDLGATMDAGISLGHVHFMRRDLKRARTTLARGLGLARDQEERYQEIRALVLSAMVQVEAGQLENALALASYGIKMAERMPMPVGQMFGLAVKGLALGGMGRMDEAVESSTAAVALLREQSRPESAEEILYYHAFLCEQAGHIGRAGTAITEAYRALIGKMSGLQDAELAATYRASRIPQAIIESHERLIGPVGESAGG